MAVKKIDYSKTIIYKIVCKNPDINQVYIGNTTNFRKRKSQHKSTCNNSNSKGYNISLYKFIRENNGWNNFDMIEIEKFPCTDGNESRARERYYFDLLNATLNLCRPLVTKDELIRYDKKRKQTEHYKENMKQYLKQYCKQYEEENKIKIAERKSEKITCSCCNAIMSRSSKGKHERSFKHISHTQALFTDDEIIHA